MNRRQFVKLVSSAYGLGMVSANTLNISAQETSFNDYKCLVSIFLTGGNDAFNLVTPRSDSEYNIYSQARLSLALDQSDLLPIVPENPDGADYGFHPKAIAFQNLFESGKLAIVANTGPLIEPVTKSAFQNGSVAIPNQLFSHNDQRDQWQSLAGNSSLDTGWAGRIADLFSSQTGEQKLALNISAAGGNLFQVGSQTRPYSIGTSGASAYRALEKRFGFGEERRAAFDKYLAAGFDNIHSRALADVHQRSLASTDLVNNALLLAPSFNGLFPSTRLGKRLRIVAKLIAIKDEFYMSRQIFNVKQDGYDTHDNQNRDQPNLIDNLSRSIGAFNEAMIQIGMEDHVVTFTQSDFGRSLSSNGDGTDHGWGGHQLVIGNPVFGRKIYGTMPRLEIDGPDDARGGRMIPTLSVDQYAATLARWFGVEETNLMQIAPNLANFTNSDIGFL